MHRAFNTVEPSPPVKNTPDFIEQWLQHLMVERGRSALTVESYARSLNLFRRWLKASSAQRDKAGDLRYATREDVQRFTVAELRRVSGRSAYQRFSALRSFYKFLDAEDICPCNPMRGLKMPRYGHKLPDWLNPKQTRRLLRSAEKADSFLAVRNALLLHFLYGSGLRASEGIGICLSDIEHDLSAVRVRGKGGIERLTPLSSQTKTLLQRYLASPEAPVGEDLFPRFYEAGSLHFRGQSPTRGHISRVRVWQIVHDAAKAARISAHPHTLRHSAGAAMTCNGADVSTVQAFLGHSSPETTMIYSHLDLATLRRAFNRHHPRA